MELFDTPLPIIYLLLDKLNVDDVLNFYYINARTRILVEKYIKTYIMRKYTVPKPDNVSLLEWYIRLVYSGDLVRVIINESRDILVKNVYKVSTDGYLLAYIDIYHDLYLRIDHPNGKLLVLSRERIGEVEELPIIIKIGNQIKEVQVLFDNFLFLTEDNQLFVFGDNLQPTGSSIEPTFMIDHVKSVQSIRVEYIYLICAQTEEYNFLQGSLTSNDPVIISKQRLVDVNILKLNIINEQPMCYYTDINYNLYSIDLKSNKKKLLVSNVKTFEPMPDRNIIIYINNDNTLFYYNEEEEQTFEMEPTHIQYKKIFCTKFDIDVIDINNNLWQHPNPIISITDAFKMILPNVLISIPQYPGGIYYVEKRS